ncbi:MAG: hypoxanthine phosphoribosyltransferase [Dehalococcoidia bacterium]
MGNEETERKLVCLYTAVEIAEAVQRLAGELDQDYAHRFPVLVGVLKGSFIFLADLVRRMKVPLRSIEFLRMSSYGSATVSSGNPQITLGLSSTAVAGRDVVVIEDIVDTGITTSAALTYLQDLQPASVKICTLLDKPSRRQVSVEVSYVGFTVPDKFIVGYGIDFDQEYRQLPHIYTLD